METQAHRAKGKVKSGGQEMSAPHNFPCNWNACKCVLTCGESIAFLYSLRRRSPFLDILTL